MKKYGKVISFALIVLTVLSNTQIFIQSNAANYNEPFEILCFLDKENYKFDEKVKLKILIKNTSGENQENVSAFIESDDYCFVNSDTTRSFDLPADSSIEEEYVLTISKSSNVLNFIQKIILFLKGLFNSTLFMECKESPENRCFFAKDLKIKYNNKETGLHIVLHYDKKQNEVCSDYKEILSGTKFTASFNLKTNVSGESLTLPILVARSGNMYCLETTMPINENGSTKCNILLRDGTCYIIFPTFRSYYLAMISDSGEIYSDEEIDTPESNQINELIEFANSIINNEVVKNLLNGSYITNKGTYKDSYTTMINQKTYNVYIYESEGQTVKYYYLNGILKRIETVMGDDTNIMEINYVSKNVDSSKFEVPVGYIDIRNLINEESNN